MTGVSKSRARLHGAWQSLIALESVLEFGKWARALCYGLGR